MCSGRNTQASFECHPRKQTYKSFQSNHPAQTPFCHWTAGCPLTTEPSHPQGLHLADPRHRNACHKFDCSSLYCRTDYCRVYFISICIMSTAFPFSWQCFNGHIGKVNSFVKHVNLFTGHARCVNQKRISSTITPVVVHYWSEDCSKLFTDATSRLTSEPPNSRAASSFATCRPPLHIVQLTQGRVRRSFLQHICCLHPAAQTFGTRFLENKVG